MSEENDIVRCGLIQLANPINDESVPVADIQEAMFQKHIPYIEEAGKKGVQILCLQEIFNGPYFALLRTLGGMPRQKQSRDRPVTDWRNMPRNMRWSSSSPFMKRPCGVCTTTRLR